MSRSAELEDLAKRAAEAATAAGASDAEGWAEGGCSREVRVHAGEVESLTEASGRGVGVRAWIGSRTGYAYGTDLSDAGLGELAEAAVGAARVADEDENSAAPEPSGEPSEIPGLRDEGVASTETAEVIELAKRVERASLDRDERVTAVEEVVYVDEDSSAAIATSRGVSGAFAVSVAYSFLQAMATEDSEVQTGLGFGVARGPGDLDAAEIGAEAGEEASSMLGATKPESRTCPVVLSDRVAASFAGFVGGAVSADEVQ
ncbi:MAG TPA: DNA gyrase modulator, partial [Solirubrobacterales bacterium]|nr:DNA gyrase modulator [Solirubrobacterales bacterium]